MPHINKIELRGFKSFGNTKVTIPLSKGLTAIVGPNGMGKSNVIDALCFVLGWMSAKTMRAERFSDLLFNGGNGGRPAPFAEVSLHFDNDDGGLQINSKDVIITRQVHRDGKCTYRINKRRATREEIVDLLAAKMTCPGGYNFVMQGEVNRFFNMGTVERRNIIDDLAGVAEFDEKKQKSLNELQKVEANLNNVGAVLTEISNQMENLRGQMETAIYFKQLKRERDQIQGALLQIRKEKYAKKLSQLKLKTSDLGKDVEVLRSRHKKILDGKEKLDKKIADIAGLIDEKRSSDVLIVAERARTEITTLGDILKRTEERKSRLNQDMETLSAQIKKLRALRGSDPNETLASLSSKFGTLHGKFMELCISLGKCESLASTKAAINQLKEVLGDLSKTLKKISESLGEIPKPGQKSPQEPSEAKLREELIGLQRTRDEFDMQVSDFKNKIQTAQARLESADSKEKEIRSSIDSLTAQRSKFRQKVEFTTKKARELETKIMGMDGDLQRFQIQRDALAGELREINASLKKIGEVNMPKNADTEALEKKAQTIDAEISSLSEKVNLRAIQDFRESEKRHNEEKLKHDKLNAEKQSLLDFMSEIDEKKKHVFMKTFNDISNHFTQIFKELSPDGDAKLKLENEESPFDGGLEIIARPEGSGALYIGSLSGGQKALTALAFIFALQRYRPSTFYVLDEIDAHLDPKNRARVAEMLRNFSRESQIVVITLHDAIMSSADRLFGVTKENGISRLYSVELSGIGG
ncbi:MAG: AAA family ATPase [Methanobacteriota archaeon]